jgi:chromosome partitioning protein
MRVLSVINQKGGVGKTTTAMNLGHALALRGYRVLALDLDPQSHLSASLGIHGARQGMDSVLLGEAALADVAVEVRDGLSLVPAGPRLNEVDSMTQGGADRGWLLHNAIQEMKDDYDFVITDCPPSAGVLAMNAIFAAQELLIPVSGDFLALHGLSRLMGILARFEKSLKRDLAKWIVLTRFQERRRHSQEVRDKILEYFNGQVLATTVRESVVLTESPSFGKTIFDYRPTHRSAEEFHALAEDLLERRVH